MPGGERVHGEPPDGEQARRPRVAPAKGSAIMPSGGASFAVKKAADWRCAGPPPDEAISCLGFRGHDLGAPAGCERVAECARAAAAVHPLEAPEQGGRAMSVADRVLRAEDALGVLDVALSEEGVPPSDAEVARAFEEVRDALDHQGRSEAAREGRIGHGTMCANWCVNWALAELSDRDARSRAYFEALRRSKEAVLTVACPVDVGGLRLFAESREANVAVCSKTGESLSQRAMDLASRVGPPDWAGTAWVDLTYRHSFIGARLIAAGHVAFSRVYAVERHDPFKYPREVRRAALGRFGVDLDDKAAYPSAMAALFVQGGASLRTYLANRSVVVRSLAEEFFGRADEEVMGYVKQLLISMDMGGSPGGWASQHRDLLRQGVDVRAASVECVGGARLSVAAYCRDREARVEEFAERLPWLVLAVRRMNARRRAGKRDELTALSYLLQHYEGASREAKRGWLTCRGGLVFSLQHDGVMVSLPEGLPHDRVAADLGGAVSAVLGFSVRVEVKSRPEAGSARTFAVRPRLCGVPSHPPPAGEGADGDPGPGLSAVAARAFDKAMGQAVKRAAPRLQLPGPDQLSVDGGTRRVVYSYRKDEPVGSRSWAQRVVGGFHDQWCGQGPEWLEWACQAYRLADDGRLVGDRAHPRCPLAAVFWWECDEIVRKAGRPVGVEEARFVLLKLLAIEAEYPVTHFVASDGSRKEGDRANPETRIGRVAVSVSRDGVRVLGGRMAESTRGFDRHSYEAETEAFLDHLADCSG